MERTTFEQALQRAKVPLDVAVLWADRLEALRTLSAERVAQAWQTALKRLRVLRADLDAARAEDRLRADLELIECTNCYPEALEKQSALDLLRASLAEAADVRAVALVMIDLEQLVRSTGQGEVAWSVGVDCVRALIKSTDANGCSDLLAVTINRLRQGPPDKGGGAPAVALAPPVDAGEAEVLEGAQGLLATAPQAEVLVFEELRSKIRRKSQSYDIAVSYAARRVQLGSLRAVAKGLTIARLTPVCGGEQDADAALEGVVQHWEKRLAGGMRRAA